MLERLRKLNVIGADAADDEERTTFTALRLVTAELFLAAGANALLQALRNRSPRTRPDASTEFEVDVPARAPYRLPAATAWVPAILAPLAGAAHAVHAVQPSDASQTATRVLNGAVVGLGVAALADSAYAAIRGEEPFSFGPLLFGYAGVLGLFLDRQESAVDETERELQRRARIVERFVPRRRPKLDRIVVHV